MTFSNSPGVLTDKCRDKYQRGNTVNGFNLTEKKIESLRTDRNQEVFADSKCRGFGVRVSGATGSKTFVVRYTVGGARKITVIGDSPAWTVKDARHRAQSIQDEARIGIDVVAEKRAADGRATLGAFWPAFMAHKKLSSSTVRAYSSLFERHLKEAWGSRRMVDVKRADVAELLTRKEHEPTTHNHIRSLILNVWNTAIALGFGEIENNPAYKYPKQVEEPRRRAFTLDELALLWKGFESAPLVIGGVFKMATLTAQRQGQVRMMRWADIEGPTWKCPATFTKGKREQWIPLSDAALEVLETVRGLSDVWVFPSMRDDNTTGHVGTLSHQFGRLAKAEGIKDARCHDLRTTFGTFCLQPAAGTEGLDPSMAVGLGVALPVVSECLSHKPDALAFDRYAHPDARAAHLIVERRAALSAWADFLNRS